MKIQRKNDNTFIVEFNGLPFHVTPDYPTSELYGIEMTHAAINEYAEAYPEEVTDYVEPAVEIPEISEEQQPQRNEPFEARVTQITARKTAIRPNHVDRLKAK